MSDSYAIHLHDIVAKSRLEGLRPGTIVKGTDPDNPPLICHGTDGFQVGGRMVGLNDLHAETFEVLWLPEVEVPKVGETVIREQLDALPRYAVVQDREMVVYQQIAQGQWLGEDLDRSPNNLPETDRGSAQDVWRISLGHLTLLWLPQEDVKG
jgi:hypothetical protein